MKLGPIFGLLSGVAAAGTVFVAVDVVGRALFHIADAGAPTPEATPVQPRSATEAASTAEPHIADPTASGNGSESAAASVAPSGPASGAASGATPAGLDLVAGEKVFKKCTACHDAKAAGKHKTGPNLWGILNRPAHAAEGFKYSEAMLGHAAPWGPEELDRYLTNPKTAIPGNKMAFAGLPKAADRHNLIAWLAAQSDTPLAPEALPFAGAVASSEAAPEASPEATPAEEIAQIPYQNPPERTAGELAEVAAKVAALQAELPGLDYQRARYHPIHFPPAIESASNEECLVCHQEIIEAKPRAESPAGVKAAESIAWYQTLDTYTGDQADFHYRHLRSEFAVEVMNLECNFCHKGNDPREESPDMMALRATFSAGAQPEFTNRKMVNVETTCLRCHGAMPDPVEIMGLSGPWHEARLDLEDPNDPAMVNGCLSCHGELFRTNRHNVSYLKAANIEELAKEVSSDTCYGCHGGRSWYRISYPYPRHAWPGMDPETPAWAEGRPSQSDEAYRLAPAAGQ